MEEAMETTITFDSKDVLICVLIIAGVVLAVFLIVAAYNLIKTLQKSQKGLDDFEVVAEIASKRSKQLDKIIDDTSKKLKAGQNIFNAIPIIFSAIAKIAKVAGQNTKKQ